MYIIKSILSTRNKKSITLSLIFLLIVYIFTNYNYHWYKQTILKVTNTINTTSESKTGVNGNIEQCYTQKITGIIKNGNEKGKSITFPHNYTFSEVSTEKYKKGDKLFVSIKKNGTVTILNEKRDTAIILLVTILLISLLLISKLKGMLTILSLVFNIAAYWISLKFFKLGVFLDIIWFILVLFFCIVTLLLVSGFHKKTIGSIISSILTVLVIYLLSHFTIYKTDEIPYEMMPYIYAPLPLAKIYMISVLFGSLGAIMDVAITINSAVSELVTTNNKLTIKKLIHSIQEIGYDIMGTMMNVMFFSYISSSLPLIILKIQSGFGLGVIFRYDYIFDITRFLLASIGIIVTIPVSGCISILLFQKGLNPEK